MLLRAQLLQIDDGLGILQRLVPSLSRGQENGYGLLRLDNHVDVAAIRTRVIRPPAMIVRGVQPHALIIGGEPIENSLLTKGRPGERTNQQKREKEWYFGVSHSNSIETRRSFPRKVSAQTCLLEVS